jgi:hypothetical protein
MGVHAEFENLSDPIACQDTACIVATSLSMSWLCVSTLISFRLRVSKIDYQMSFRDQLLRVGRVAVFLQVAGRGYGKNSRVQQRVISMDVLTVSEPPEEATRLRLPHAAFDVESEGLSRDQCVLPAFWSVTMYDGKSQFLIKNPINRYLINSPMLPQMKKNPDGSLTLYIQKDSPGKAKESNWLPAANDTIYPGNAPLQ